MARKLRPCPHRKVRHLTEQHATDVMRAIWARPGKMPSRVYQCPLCFYWHTTSKKRKGA